MFITSLDFLLLPLYIGLFFFFVKRRAALYTDPDLKKIFFFAFFLRMFGSVAYSCLIQFYYGYGDSFTYYIGSDFLHTQLIKNAGNIKYFFASAADFEQWYTVETTDNIVRGYIAIPSSTAVMKISAILSFLSFNRYMIISLFFGLFSFAGQWKLFRVFSDYTQGKNQKILATAVLYTPSIWFWGSGLMKDSICLGAVGFIIHILYKNIVKREINLKQWLILPVLVFIIFIIKSYIIMILLGSIMAVIFVRYVWQLKNILVRIAVILIFLIFSSGVIIFSDIPSQVNEIVQESYAQVQSFQQNYQSLQSEDATRSGFEVGEIDQSLSSMAIKAPQVIFTCLFRPFLWESRKIIIFFTALESTMLLIATLYLLFKTKFVGFFSITFKNPLILFSFVSSIFFALVIGFTTFNFGTMIRYKIILLPFYYFMLVAIYNKITPEKLPDALPS